VLSSKSGRRLTAPPETLPLLFPSSSSRGSQMGEVKFGDLKGVDVNGNKYFENVEYPFGQHRWVEYKVGRERERPGRWREEAWNEDARPTGGEAKAARYPPVSSSSRARSPLGYPQLRAIQHPA